MANRGRPATQVSGRANIRIVSASARSKGFELRRDFIQAAFRRVAGGGQPLRRQIAVFNVAIVLPLALLIGWSARRTYLDQIELLAGETRALAAAVVVYLDRGLDVKSLQTVIQDIPLPAGSVITLTDNQAVVLARSAEPERYVGRRVDDAPLPAAAVPHRVQRIGVDGVERVFANDVYLKGPWLISVGIPTSVAFARVAAIVRRNGSIALGATLFALLLQFFLLRAYARSFDLAKTFTRRVAGGDLSPVTPIKMPSREMEEIQRSVIDMVDKLRAAREAIAAQVTEERRIREELESLQRQVIRQERLAAIGVLVSGVAHELNNPLQAILGFAELLHMRSDLPRDVRQELALIQKEGARASAIIRNLSQFSRQQTAKPAPVDLRSVIASVVELRQRNLEDERITLNVIEANNPVVLAVFAELQQVVLNFVINAEQALANRSDPRLITVRTGERDQQAWVEVQDNGPGVPRDDEPKLFQPFFTTKPVGEGTGLGLSVSYGIIQSHGGTIGYRPGDEGGAIFYFSLPVMANTQPA
jgi:C4-dicarboxylate-specific signal transduction histidine kinase